MPTLKALFCQSMRKSALDTNAKLNGVEFADVEVRERERTPERLQLDARVRAWSIAAVRARVQMIGLRVPHVDIDRADVRFVERQRMRGGVGSAREERERRCGERLFHCSPDGAQPPMVTRRASQSNWLIRTKPKP